MNIISIILILIVVFSIVNGIIKGFIISTASLLSWLGSLLLTLYLYPHVAELWKNLFADNSWTIPLSILFTLLIAAILLSTLFNNFVLLFTTKTHFHPINRAAGVVPGAVTGLLYAAIATLFLLIVPLSEKISTETRDSKIAQKFSLKLEQVENNLKPELKEAINRTMQLTMIEEGSKESVSLPFSVNDPAVREDLETEMLAMINVEREKQGLTLLKADSELTEVARNHSRDMFARSYFSHNTPGGLSPFDRIREANIMFLSAGENLALAQTLQIAHEGLMNSPGHRANILRSSFGRVGIGVLDGGKHGLMITQVFKN